MLLILRRLPRDATEAEDTGSSTPPPMVTLQNGLSRIVAVALARASLAGGVTWSL